MKPVNFNSVIGIILQTMPTINAAMEDKDLTVDELIDIMTVAAKASADAAGISDKVIATTRTSEQ